MGNFIYEVQVRNLQSKIVDIEYLTKVGRRVLYDNLASKKKKEVTVKPEYLLVDVSEYVNVVLVGGNAVNVDENTTKEKVKVKVKVKEYLINKISENGLDGYSNKILFKGL